MVNDMRHMVNSTWHINIRIRHSGSKDQCDGDARNDVVQEPYLDEFSRWQCLSCGVGSARRWDGKAEKLLASPCVTASAPPASPVFANPFSGTGWTFPSSSFCLYASA